MRLIAYLRVSTDTQAEEGAGLAVQASMIREWSARRRHEIVAWEEDAGISGTRAADQRPGLAGVLLAVRNGEADGIVVRDLDRLAREVTVQEAVLAELWRRPDVRVFSVTTGEVLRDDPDDPMRTAMRQMMGVFAGLERRMLVKRLRDGRKAKAARGGHAVGPPRYGWQSEGGELVAVPAEQRALKRMRKLHAQGLTTREIAETLSAEGHPTKRGGRWTSPVVSRILARHKPSTRATRAA